MDRYITDFQTRQRRIAGPGTPIAANWKPRRRCPQDANKQKAFGRGNNYHAGNRVHRPSSLPCANIQGMRTVHIRTIILCVATCRAQAQEAEIGAGGLRRSCASWKMVRRHILYPPIGQLHYLLNIAALRVFISGFCSRDTRRRCGQACGTQPSTTGASCAHSLVMHPHHQHI